MVPYLQIENETSNKTKAFKQFLSKISIIVRLTIFFYRENEVFASRYTTVKINTAMMQ